MKYILVHGAWHGGWCWDRVRTELEASGHKVYTPTLTGLGDCAHLLSPDIGLETHVNDIVSLVEDEKISDVVLVGHSYAGVVTTVVADRIAEKLARLVYLDAVVPKSGQCMLDLIPAEYREYLSHQTKINGDGWKVPVIPKEALGLEVEKDIDWVMPRLVPHPYRTVTDLAYFNPETNSSIPKSYISCIDENLPDRRKSIQAEGIDDYYELPAGHDAMVIAPVEVAELLQKIVAQQ